MPRLPASSFDAIITDPPYGLKLHDAPWDAEVPGTPYWQEALRILRPGGHLAAFGATKTSHRLATNIESAGFEIRDTLMWIYASGLNKSKNPSATIDRWGGDHNIVEHRRALAAHIKECRERAGLSLREMQKLFGDRDIVVNWQRPDKGFRVPSEADFALLVEHLGCEPSYFAAVRNPVAPKVVGEKSSTRARRWSKDGRAGFAATYDVTEPATAAAKKWNGWGACLTPAVEPIVLARKPFSGSLGQSLLANGAGALNLKGARNALGRLPSNLLHDGSAEAIAGFPGATSKYFYSAKSTKAERGHADHPAQKPMALMRWLVRLLVPPGGIVLDPFAGSGTTGAAAVAEGIDAVLIERDGTFAAMASDRLRNLG
jgi:site-specific DNA-methyltransferase (adenine-specific)